MPPATFIDKVAGVIVGATVTFAIPTKSKPGDVMTAIILTDPAVGQLDATSDPSWEFLQSFAGANATVLLARRVAAADDDDSIVLLIDSLPVWALAVMRVDRGLDPNAAMIAGGFNDVNASINFQCPSRALVHYSDLYMGVVGVSSAAVAVTPPGGTTERYDAGGGGRELELFDLLPEAVGATGVKTATTAANQSGIALSLLFATFPVVVAKTFGLDPPGCPGLPIRGV